MVGILFYGPSCEVGTVSSLYSSPIFFNMGVLVNMKFVKRFLQNLTIALPTIFPLAICLKTSGTSSNLYSFTGISTFFCAANSRQSFKSFLDPSNDPIILTSLKIAWVGFTDNTVSTSVIPTQTKVLCFPSTSNA